MPRSVLPLHLFETKLVLMGFSIDLARRNENKFCYLILHYHICIFQEILSINRLFGDYCF